MKIFLSTLIYLFPTWNQRIVKYFKIDVLSFLTNPTNLNILFYPTTPSELKQRIVSLRLTKRVTSTFKTIKGVSNAKENNKLNPEREIYSITCTIFDKEYTRDTQIN